MHRIDGFKERGEARLRCQRGRRSSLAAETRLIPTGDGYPLSDKRRRRCVPGGLLGASAETGALGGVFGGEREEGLAPWRGAGL